MTRKPDRPRGFEDRLLSELKTHVSERTQTMSTEEITPAPRFSRGKKVSLAGAVGAVALGIGAIVALPALTASPAYAVEKKDDGNVHIEVYGPVEPEELEAALAEYGVQSHVDFPPKGMGCDPDRYESAEDDGILSEMMSASSHDGEPAFTFDVNPDNYEIGGDTTLVVEIGEDFFEGIGEDGEYEVTLAAIGIGAAKGEIGDCDPRLVDEDVEIVDAEKDDDGSKSKD